MHSIISATTLLLASLASAYVVPAGAPAGLVSRQAGSVTIPGAASCSLNGAALPLNGKGLPAPSAGSYLSHVVIGRGTQNYTCADSTSASVPVANGAVAMLFNASCMAAPYPSLVTSMPSIALRYPIPSAAGGVPAADVFLAGHHFFTDKTTAFFDLNTPQGAYGSAACKKENAVDAPDAKKDVPWLRLSVKSATGCDIAEVYRVDTAGGVAPATCEGQKSEFEVQYAASYWFYSRPSEAYPSGAQ